MQLSIFQIVVFLLYFQIYSTVKVSVFYETLCPDCTAFIKNQLHPNYKAFGGDLINLELIPYGFAHENEINGSKIFTCQHGPNECYGNKVHGCVIYFYPIITSESFAACCESSDEPASNETFERCASSNQVSWSAITKCISSGKGDDIMEINEKKTAQLNPQSVPAIVFNDEFNENDSQQSIDDFKGVVCKYLDNKPPMCGPHTNPNVIVL